MRNAFLKSRVWRSLRTPPILLTIICLGAISAGVFAKAYAGQDADARARAIVRRMTLDEKIQELHGTRTEVHKRFVPGVPRLGIPDFIITNGPAGAGPGDAPARKQIPATALPAPILLASTWDRKLARLHGEIAAAEAKDLGSSLLEAPDINIARVPQNGRTFEGYGEDPYLTGQISLNNIEGIQSQGVMANVKHFAANNQETGRRSYNEVIDERTLREIYLPAFEISVNEAHSATVMCAYPHVNGEFACENDVLLDQILRKEWGFPGFVISDFGATHSTVASALAGLDLEMPGAFYYADELKQAVQSEQVPESVIDEMLVRRFRTMMEYGVFDHPPVPKPIPVKQDGIEARKIAEAGIVLLKNSGGLLPLDPKHVKSILLIGSGVEEASTGGGGSSHVVPLYAVDTFEGIHERVGAAVHVTFAPENDLFMAKKLASSADVVIVSLTNNDAEGRDHSLAFGQDSNDLVATVAAVNPHTIVLMRTGSPMLLPWVDAVPALLEAWYPGEEDGNAVAAVLFGDVNPSGKLPVTFPKSLADLPANTPEQYPGVNNTVHYTEGVFVGYRHFDADSIEPLFPFGFGLSYTTFAYKNLAISPGTITLTGDATPAVNVEFDVTNTGKVAGSEVAELYVGLPSTDDVPEPPRQLKGFDKVNLKPGETRHVRLALDARAFSYWDVKAHAWAVMPGTAKVMVGASSRDIRLDGAVTIEPASH
ncbi:MAG: glycoside hydrolase family 3 C-terminal domain-containing protein [Candidatus Acidiferrales bacterium]